MLKESLYTISEHEYVFFFWDVDIEFKDFERVKISADLLCNMLKQNYSAFCCHQPL